MTTTTPMTNAIADHPIRIGEAYNTIIDRKDSFLDLGPAVFSLLTEKGRRLHVVYARKNKNDVICYQFKGYTTGWRGLILRDAGEHPLSESQKDLADIILKNRGL